MFGARDLLSRLKVFSQRRPSFFKPVIGLERGLTDPVVDLNMGQTAEILAQLFNISRLDADTYAMESHHRLARAQKERCSPASWSRLSTARARFTTSTTACGRTARWNRWRSCGRRSSGRGAR